MKWLPGAVGVLLITVGAVGCSSQPSAFADRVNAAQQATIPPGGELLQPPVLSSDSTKSTAHWTVSTQMDWTSYVSWLGARVGTYRRTADTGEALHFNQSAPGDAYDLAVARNGTGVPLHVDVTLTGRPD